MEGEENKKEEVNNTSEEKKVEVINTTEENNNTQSANQTPKNESKGLAVASMVLGIISLLMWCVMYISIPCAILAIIFGAVARKKAGRGMAIAGLVLGIISFVIMVITIVLGVSIFSSIFSSPDKWENFLDKYESYDYDNNLRFNYRINYDI